MRLLAGTPKRVEGFLLPLEASHGSLKRGAAHPESDWVEARGVSKEGKEMEGRGFSYCCGAYEIGSFYSEETAQSIEEQCENSLQIATLAEHQIRTYRPKLIAAGFVEAGSFINKNTQHRVWLYIRGLTFEKGGPMVPKKTKKTITLKTGKKIVKKVTKR